jgi:hypothetical protein
VLEGCSEPIPSLQPQFKVLIFSKTVGIRHDSIPADPRGVVHVLLTLDEAHIRVERWDQTILWRGAKPMMAADLGIPRTGIPKRLTTRCRTSSMYSPEFNMLLEL